MIKLHDVEIYPDFFCTTIEDYNTEEKEIFEISKRKNELKEIYNTYLLLHKNKGFLVSFNGIHYDSPMINYILINYPRLKELGSEEITKELKKFSDFIISTDFWWKEESFKNYKYQQEWRDIDLFLFWSKMLRRAKRISLKSLGIQLGYPVVQELPYPASEPLLESSKMEEVINYNSVHDLGILRKLLVDKIYWQGKPTTFKDMENLRISIANTYDLPAYSWDAPKIASELLLQSYCKQVNKEPHLIKYAQITPDHSFTLDDPSLSTFPSLVEEMKKYGRDFKKEIPYVYNNTRIKLSYGVGGIHSVNDNEIYESNDREVVVTSDVASLYPNLIINYKCVKQPEVLDIYSKTKDERMQAKKEGNKGKDATFKLILNSTSGLLDNKYSWLYYPGGAMKMRLMGQLIMTKVIEELALAGFRVVSANTDGVEVVVEREKLEEYYKIVDTVGKKFNLEFEHEIYKKIVYKNVNSYVAVTESGKIKQKGAFFITNPNIGDSCDHLIIQKALVKYFTEDITPEDYITREDHHIYDFCLSKKVDRSYKVVFGNEILPQRLNRFYVSKKGRYLYKRKDSKDTNMLKGWGVEIYNNHIERPISEYNIDYRFYISQVNKVIQEIEIPNKIQLSLF